MKLLLFVTILLSCLVSTMAQEHDKMLLNIGGVYYHNLSKIDGSYGASISISHGGICGVIQPQPKHVGVLGGYVIDRTIGKFYTNITPLVGFQLVDVFNFDYGVVVNFIPLRVDGKSIGVSLGYTQYSLSIGVTWLFK